VDEPTVFDAVMEVRDGERVLVCPQCQMSYLVTAGSAPSKTCRATLGCDGLPVTAVSSRRRARKAVA